MAPCPLIGSHQPALWHLDAARGPSTPSFDHLVGAGEQRWRHVEAERLSSLEVDDQLELGGLNHRQVGRLGALENAPGIDPGLPVGIEDAGSVANQAAGYD